MEEPDINGAADILNKLAKAAARDRKRMQPDKEIERKPVPYETIPSLQEGFAIRSQLIPVSESKVTRT